MTKPKFFDPPWDYTPPPPYDGRFTDPRCRGRIDGTMPSLNHLMRTDVGWSAADPHERAPRRKDPTDGRLDAAISDYAAWSDRGWHLKVVSPSGPLSLVATIHSSGRLRHPRRNFLEPGALVDSQDRVVRSVRIVSR